MDRDCRLRYLAAMGISPWVRRKGGAEPVLWSSTASAPGAVQEAPARVPMQASEGPGWEELERQVASCTRCALAAGRTRTVFGVGNRQASWMLVGEGPGAEEDRQGEPFVGRAGKLLNEMLFALGLARSDVYIANVVKCRPPQNREPLPEEAAACEPYLLRQLELVAPKIILALGRISAQHLLKTQAPLGAMRGRVFHSDRSSAPIVVTYHPAYLLRNPVEKRKAWHDLLFARRIVGNER
jgi:uracil-DNA glycosylase family 4